jgi:hypothetical protein
MIITQTKPLDEILDVLKHSANIFIMGCSECAATCKTGGEKEVLEFKKILEGKGKVVTGYVIAEAGCLASQIKLIIAKNRKAFDTADAVLVLSCGLCVQAAVENFNGRKVFYAGCNTLFGGIVDKAGLGFFERCSMCGECVLNMTGGVCPVTRCAKSLLNGPCGGAKKGKCEVDKDRDCAWILIYNRLKELGALDGLKMLKPAKDYSKMNRPRQILLIN